MKRFRYRFFGEKKPKIRIGSQSAVYFILMLLSGRGEILIPNLAAALLHEAGHLTAMGLTGTEAESILITPFGAVIRKDRRLTDFRTDLIVSSAGILVNFAFALLSLPFRGNLRIFFFLLSNLALALLNLLPVSVLDGGEMLFSFLSLKCSPETAASVSSAISLLSLIPLWGAAVYFLFFGVGDPSLFFLVVCLFLTMTAGK